MSNLNFGQALEAIKQEKRVARAGWNGKGMFIYLNKGAFEGEPQASHIEGISAGLFEVWNQGIVTRLPNINMKASSGSTVTGWLASQTDMLAEDWTVLD